MAQNSMFARLRRPFVLRLFMLQKLPAAWFMGLRLVEITEKRCVIGLPFSWRSQNPFRSIYFAAQVAAGEMSTGLIAQALLAELPPVSMLVVKIESEFFKKAADLTHFTCEEGEKVAATIRRALETDEPQMLKMTSIGSLAASGEVVSKVEVTWSFKKRNK